MKAAYAQFIDQAMADFREGWSGTWHLNPQLGELRIATVAPGVALAHYLDLYNAVSGRAGALKRGNQALNSK